MSRHASITADQHVVFVTGGAGFIGSNLVRRLLQHSAQTRVVNLDLLTYAGHRTSLADLPDPQRHELVPGDIADCQLVEKLLTQHRPVAVLNLAAESHVDRSIDSPDAFITTNVMGSANLLKQSLAYWEALDADSQQAFRFVQVSTDEVYGSLGPTGKFTEGSAYRPNSPYSASKAAADHLTRAYHATYGLPAIIANSSNNYGPRQFPEKLIPLVTLAALQDQPLPVYGDGSHVRDWLFVTDLCDALVLLVGQGKAGEVYNIGGDTERSTLEVVRTVCKAVDQLKSNPPNSLSERLIEFVADRPGHDRRYAVDASKLRTQTSWRPTVKFEEGIQQVAAWYAANGQWVDTVSSAQQRGRLGLRRSSKL